MKTYLLLALASLSLAGCNYVSLKDGKIPQEYLAPARAYAGTYHGHFNGHRGRLVIAIANQTARVSFEDGRGNDLLGGQCRSRIGRLEGVNISSDRKRVKAAHFAFSPGACRIEGRSLALHLQRDGSLEARVVKSSHTIPGGITCRPVGPIEHGGEICTHDPDTTVYTYLEGSFRK